jgi:hypothetical protein
MVGFTNGLIAAAESTIPPDRGQVQQRDHADSFSRVAAAVEIVIRFTPAASKYPIQRVTADT